MSEQRINAIVSSGTNAERLAYTPSLATPASGPDPSVFFLETDTGKGFAWDFGGAAWAAVNGGGDLLAANNLSDLANAGTARTNLGATTVGDGLFTLANPSAVTFLRVNADNTVSALSASAFRSAIGAGTGTGDLVSTNNLSDVANAGTARTNLGLAIGSNVQAYNANLAAIAGLTSAADKVPYFTGAGTAALADLTAFARTMLDDATQGDMRDTLDVYARDEVDSRIAGLSWKKAVRAATTANGTLASSFENGDTIDGVTLATGDRILIKNQSSGAENGIYTVNASGAPTRATDADAGAELVNASVYVSEGTTNADTQWVCTTNATITVGSTSLTFVQFSAAGATINQGVHTIPILAGAMTPRTTGGAAAGSTESATNKVMLRTLDFDASTAEYAQIIIPMEKSWDEGTVTVQFLWASTATGNVIWGCQAVALSDDDVIDAAFGTAQTVTDGVTATTDIMESAFTSAITIAGSPAAEDLVCFQFYRDAANGSDTCTADARLIGVRIKYTINAGDDS